MMSVIVADAGPLIAFAKISRLKVLSRLFTEVIIPSEVVCELRLNECRPGVASLAAAIRNEGWIRVVESESNLPHISGLDEGETAAIMLAVQLNCPLLIDERRGRKSAVRRNVKVVGTGRILIAAKQHGLIGSVRSELQELRNTGYRLSDALCLRIMALADED